jgi:hypothetical protein
VQCANPNCKAPAVDLSAGVLRLIELDVPPAKRVIRSDGGFPVCSVPSRYFWQDLTCDLMLGYPVAVPLTLTQVLRFGNRIQF